jgi:hypothetical protein
VLIGGCEWTPVNVLLEETALTLTLLVEDWEVNPQACGTEKRFCNYIIENPNGAMNHRFVKIEKQGGQGLGIRFAFKLKRSIRKLFSKM